MAEPVRGNHEEHLVLLSVALVNPPIGDRDAVGFQLVPGPVDVANMDGGALVAVVPCELLLVGLEPNRLLMRRNPQILRILEVLLFAALDACHSRRAGELSPNTSGSKKSVSGRLCGRARIVTC